MLPIFINILLVIHVFVSVLMLLVVLMQRPKSEGLGAAFGGGMTENIFGAQTTNVLTKFTVWLGGAFFALTLALAVLYARQTSGEGRVTTQLLQEEAVVPAVPDASSPAEAVAPQTIPEPTTETSTPETTAPEAAAPEATAPAAVEPAPEVKAPETSLFATPNEPVAPLAAPATEPATEAAVEPTPKAAAETVAEPAAEAAPVATPAAQ